MLTSDYELATRRAIRLARAMRRNIAVWTDNPNYGPEYVVCASEPDHDRYQIVTNIQYRKLTRQ